jgi:peroxiredoxin family protein
MTATETNTDTSNRLVPDFGDDAADRKMCFVCSKGTLDMAYPALIMANGALNEGVETHLFFTFWGMDMITKKTMDHLKFTILGNPATHMPQGLGGLPGMTQVATWMMKKQIAGLDVPEVPEFLEMLVDMGAHLWACKMSVDMMDLEEDDLFDGVEAVINVGEFIELSDGAQIVFV